LVDEVGSGFELTACADADAEDVVEFLADFGKFCGMLLEQVIAVVK
jgi:hypothetical protein